MSKQAFPISARLPLAFLSLLLAFLVAAVALFAQSARPNSASSSDSAGVPYAARRAAAEQVSLSSEKIIEILKQEPGLLLVVKRDVVEKAYEQGRILEAEDLTDEALFDLVRDSAQVRILATHEIEDRYYIRALPTRQERLNSHYRSLEKPAQPVPPTADQEQAYWALHDVNPLSPPVPVAPAAPAAAPPPAPAPQPAVPDQNRQLQRARGQSFQENDQFFSTLDGFTPNGNLPSGVPPEQRPGLLSASATDLGPSSGMGAPSSPISSGLAGSDPLSFGYGLDSYGSSLDPISGGDYGNSEPLTQASLQDHSQPPIPKYEGTRYQSPELRHHANPYANVPSLYDLYAQYGTSRGAKLDRFGADVFVNGSGNVDELPMDLPAGPDYILGPGDGLTLNVWGSVSQRLRRVVDREGRLSLPEVGTIQVAGRNLGEVQRDVQAALRTQFRDAQAEVSLSRLRTVRVYVVGDVVRPGAYDIPSLSTPLNAVYEAGGPTSRGSIRDLKHYRGKQLLQEVDVYDLILHGVRSDIRPLESGDTILVPPIGPQVAVEGMVRRPAIYELNGEKSLADTLALAGGVLPTGALRHIEVERIEAHQSRSMLSLDLPDSDDQSAVNKALQDFQVQDGDRVKISPILPYVQKTVYLDGHVFRPGKYTYHDGMKLTDLIKGYSDLLPEPYRAHAEIIRLAPPDFTPVVVPFNLGDALTGKDVPVLQPFDTVRVFGRYDFEDAPEVSVSGEVREPGDHRTNGVTHVSDAIFLAGGTTPDAALTDAQVYRKDPDGEVRVLSVNLSKALAHDPLEDVLLRPNDRVIVHRDLAKVDPASVLVEGQVARPGRYALGQNMTAATLVRLAGGFTRSAYTQSADLSRYVLQNGTKVVGEHMEIPIAKAMGGTADTDFRLRDGDVLTIRQISGWQDISATITLKGEVTHPGIYGIRPGERLSSVIQRAGGFTASAYTYGAVLERVRVRELGEQNRLDLIRRIEATGTGDVKGSATGTGQEQAALVQAALQQQQQIVSNLKSQTASGRLVIHISADAARWRNGSSDLELRDGDVLTVPKRPDFVMLSGQVYNPSTITYVAGKSADWYLRQGGGATDAGNKKAIFIVRADGSVVANGSGGSGLWKGSVLSTRLEPGDTVVVPEKIISGSSILKDALATAQIVSAAAVTAVVAKSF